MSLYHSSGFDAQFVLKYFFYFYMFNYVMQWQPFWISYQHRDIRGHDCMVVGFTTAYVISVYHPVHCEVY
jgi:hypothetical protein